MRLKLAEMLVDHGKGIAKFVRLFAAGQRHIRAPTASCGR